MRTSLFDLFKIGIGPSSSHTVGPMRAARLFLLRLEQCGALAATRAVTTQLYGSLALTGKGHGTDKAVLLGLAGLEPHVVDPGEIEPFLDRIRQSGTLALLGKSPVPFDPAIHLQFLGHLSLPQHPNALRFTATGGAGQPLLEETYYSIGGGFVHRDGDAAPLDQRPPVPFPFHSAAELLAVCRRQQLPVWELVLENERTWRSQAAIEQGVDTIFQAMQDCIRRGLSTEGILPGGLDVKRRSPGLYARLRAGAGDAGEDAFSMMDWLNVYAMAVNEENAAGGRVVTAPTNGAAGVIPAVAQYYVSHMPEGADARQGIRRFFLAATAIGVLYKENASISGAEVGCQGEVGVACSMAAGGLVAALQGANEEIEHAAEIAMEHNLGMTCDPIRGLVQIPCIERNAFGAVKAVNAARMARHDTGDHKVSLDQVIRTMFQTGMDMQTKYKETSLAGLAVNVIEC